jgi:apolipoprotein D and lipocalin family protein
MRRPVRTPAAHAGAGVLSAVRRQLLVIAMAVAAAGCTTLPPITTVEGVDIHRFMGDWYVIAAIPTPFEKEVFNGVESYRLTGEGIIETTFTFNKGGFDGPVKTYRPKGFVRDPSSNAVWDMQFIWPFKAEYRVIHLNDDYTRTVIGRSKRDYVWVMARTKQIPAGDLEKITQFIASQGYDVSKLITIPHR